MSCYAAMSLRNAKFITIQLTICSTVICAVKRAVLCTSLCIGAQRCIPFVTCVAVGRAGSRVQPTPVAIEHNGLSFAGTSTTGASGDRQRRMLLSSQRPSLLGANSRTQREGGECEGKGRHCCVFAVRFRSLSPEWTLSLGAEPVYFIQRMYGGSLGHSNLGDKLL